MLVYVAVALAVAFVLRRGDGPGVLGGIVLGVTVICSYALATRLVPDQLDTYDDPVTAYRLAEPLGYWNALGLLAALGALVALGLVAHSRRSIPALAAAAVIPIMVTTLYFTFSRGAWAALIVGLVVAVARGPSPSAVALGHIRHRDPGAGVHRVCVAPRCADDRRTRLGRQPLGRGIASRWSSALPWCRRRCSRGLRVSVSRRVGRLCRRSRGRWTSHWPVWSCLRGRCSDRRRWPSRRDRRSRDALQCRPDRRYGPQRARSSACPATGAASLSRRLGRRPRTTAGRLRRGHVRVPLVRAATEHSRRSRCPLAVHGDVRRARHRRARAARRRAGRSRSSAAIRARRQRLVGRRPRRATLAWAQPLRFDWHWEMVGVTMTALLAAATGLVAAERWSAPRPRASRSRGG